MLETAKCQRWQCNVGGKLRKKVWVSYSRTLRFQAVYGPSNFCLYTFDRISCTALMSVSCTANLGQSPLRKDRKEWSNRLATPTADLKSMNIFSMRAEESATEDAEIQTETRRLDACVRLAGTMTPKGTSYQGKVPEVTHFPSVHCFSDFP
jgi:hypothetical protein